MNKITVGLNRLPHFSQLSLGIVMGYNPLVFLALAKQLELGRPGIMLGLVYSAWAFLLYWLLRKNIWIIFGTFYSLVNLVPLYFLSGQPIWNEIFEADYLTVLLFHLPLGFGLDCIFSNGNELMSRRQRFNEPLGDLALEIGSLAAPWLYLGWLKFLDLDPLSWALGGYLLLIWWIGGCYSRCVLFPSIVRSEPIQTVFGLTICGLWLYSLGFIMGYSLRDNRYFSLVYSEKISFSTVSVYYSLLFGGFIWLHLQKREEINAAIKTEVKRRQVEDEDIRRWFERQQLLRAEEQGLDQIPPDPELDNCYELAGLSRRAGPADLDKARLFWERKYNPALSGNFGPSREEERRKLERIRRALDEISKRRAWGRSG